VLRQLLVPVAVTAVLVAATLALLDGTLVVLVGYLLAVLVAGPWTTGFVAARSRDDVPALRPGRVVASLAACVAVVAALIAALGLGVLVGAGFATAIGAGAGAGVGPLAAIRAGWRTASEHVLAAGLTLASWFGALAALVVGDSMPGVLAESPVAVAFVALGASLVVVAANRRWALVAADAVVSRP
jgi:hypothetical protein